MQIQALIIDFDKTITTEDMSDILADTVGKKEEGERLNQLFHEGKLSGLTGLIQRINFLVGVSRADMEALVAKNDFLRQGTHELFAFLHEHNIVSIIASGSTIPFLEIYQKKLGVDYLVGSNPRMNGDVIVGIEESDYSGADFKARDSKAILDQLGIRCEHVVAVGDSPADKGLFDMAAISIGVDPHPNVREYCDYIVENSLAEIIPILENAMKEEYE